MNLPDMLRDENPLCERRSVTPEEWRTHGKWTQYGIGPELAALVEAADEMADDRDTQTDSGAAGRYDAARAALAAKLGGKG